MSKSHSRLAAAALVALLVPLLGSERAGAVQAPPTFCLGLNAETAEAQGYRVQIGTDGTDVLVGGNTTKDLIIGLGGDDILTGAGADDVICGGYGNDIITGGAGNDRVSGGPGNDDVTLGSGDDRARRMGIRSPGRRNRKRCALGAMAGTIDSRARVARMCSTETSVPT